MDLGDIGGGRKIGDVVVVEEREEVFGDRIF